MRYNNISLEVLIKGRTITEFPHNGRTYVEGRAGSAFEVRVTNHNDHRVEAVISVDGLSVTDGKEAGLNSTGYVLEAHESAVIPGWKLTSEQVAAFEFAGNAGGGSYAEKSTGTARNTGVIGVMAFKDRSYASRRYTTITNTVGYNGPPPGSSWGQIGTGDASFLRGMGSIGTCSNNAALVGSGGNGIGDMGWAMTMADSLIDSRASFSADSTPTINAMFASAVAGLGDPAETCGIADGHMLRTRGGGRPRASGEATKGASRRVQAQAAEPVQQNLGTAFGRAQDFATTTVSFDRGDLLAQIVVFYDDARGLRSRGIVIDRRNKQAKHQDPNPFPGVGCRPPTGWRG